MGRRSCEYSFVLYPLHRLTFLGRPQSERPVVLRHLRRRPTRFIIRLSRTLLHLHMRPFLIVHMLRLRLHLRHNTSPTPAIRTHIPASAATQATRRTLASPHQGSRPSPPRRRSRRPSSPRRPPRRYRLARRRTARPTRRGMLGKPHSTSCKLSTLVRSKMAVRSLVLRRRVLRLVVRQRNPWRA